MCVFFVVNYVIVKIIVVIKYVSLLLDSKLWNYKEFEMKVFRFKEVIVYKKKCLFFNKLKFCLYVDLFLCRYLFYKVCLLCYCI